MSDTSEPLRNGLTYADAGVDIDAGEMLVERDQAPGQVHPPARARRPRWAGSGPCST